MSRYTHVFNWPSMDSSEFPRPHLPSFPRLILWRLGRGPHPEERMAVDLHGPLDQLLRAVQHALPRHHPRVVHQDGHVPPQVLSHPLSSAVHLLAAGHVHRVRVRFPAHFAHQRGRALVGGGVGVPQDDLRAVFAELLGEQLAEASAGAGDQHQLSVDRLGARPQHRPERVAQNVVEHVQEHHLEIHQEDHLGPIVSFPTPTLFSGLNVK